MTQQMSKLSIVDETGDTAYEWPTGVENMTTEVVRRKFEELMAANNLIAVAQYADDVPDGTMGTKIKHFDSRATKITLVPGNFAGG